MEREEAEEVGRGQESSLLAIRNLGFRLKDKPSPTHLSHLIFTLRSFAPGWGSTDLSVVLP